MSYIRYIPSIYKSYWPGLNRTLRSSSVPRHVPDIDYSRYTRSTSVPPISRTRYAASPFRDRAASVSRAPPPPSFRHGNLLGSHYTDFDYKVISYMAKLTGLDDIKQYVSSGKTLRDIETKPKYPVDSFRSRYDYYDTKKFNGDYLYPESNQVLGNWRHYNLSSQTLNERNQRSNSPLVTRELTRYFGTQKRTNYLFDESSGNSSDLRYYNYRRVPYMGGSDNLKYMQYKPFRRYSNGNGNGGRCV